MTILYFGIARDHAGTAREEIDLPRGLTGGELWERLIELHPELAASRSISRLAADMAYVEDGEAIGEAREIAIIPPVAGG